MKLPSRPIAAALTNANAARRWLDADPPELEEVGQALGRIIRDGNRASEIIGRIRALVAIQDLGPGLKPESLDRLSTRSTRPSPAAWAWGCRSADRLSRRMADACGSHQAYLTVRYFSLPCPNLESRSNDWRRRTYRISSPNDPFVAGFWSRRGVIHTLSRRVGY
jgi:hypothetical protein